MGANCKPKPDIIQIQSFWRFFGGFSVFLALSWRSLAVILNLEKSEFLVSVTVQLEFFDSADAGGNRVNLACD